MSGDGGGARGSSCGTENGRAVAAVDVAARHCCCRLADTGGVGDFFCGRLTFRGGCVFLAGGFFCACCFVFLGKYARDGDETFCDDNVCVAGRW